MQEDKIRLPHNLILDECQKLTLTGASEVIRFDEESAELITSRGHITIQGNSLRLKTLSLDGGKVSITGQIDGIFYESDSGVTRRRRFWR